MFQIPSDFWGETGSSRDFIWRSSSWVMCPHYPGELVEEEIEPGTTIHGVRNRESLVAFDIVKNLGSDVSIYPLERRRELLLGVEEETDLFVAEDWYISHKKVRYEELIRRGHKGAFFKYVNAPFVEGMKSKHFYFASRVDSCYAVVAKIIDNQIWLAVKREDKGTVLGPFFLHEVDGLEHLRDTVRFVGKGCVIKVYGFPGVERVDFENWLGVSDVVMDFPTALGNEVLVEYWDLIMERARKARKKAYESRVKKLMSFV